MQIVGQELRTRNGKNFLLIPLFIFMSQGCTKPQNFFGRVVDSRLFYRIDFVEVRMDDFLRELKENENLVASINLLSSIPDPEAPSNSYDGPGILGYNLDPTSSALVKAQLFDSMNVHGAKEIDLPIDVSMQVLFKDGSGFAFSLKRRAKFEENVFHLQIFESFVRGSAYRGPRRMVDATILQNREILLKFLIGILRSLEQPSNPKVAAWFANIYPEVEPIVLSNKK